MILPGRKRVRLFQEAFSRAFDRAESTAFDGMFPGILAAIIVLFVGLACSTKIFETANPRLGYPAQLPPLDARENHAPYGLWFSLSAPEESMVVTTDDQQLFQWPLDPDSALESKGYGDFRQYLQQRRFTITEDLVMSMARANLDDKTRAVVAVDEHLTYAHFRPVMLALAGAGFSRYAFETRVRGD